MTPTESNAFDRVLAFVIVALVAASIVSFLAVVVGTQAGAGADDGFSEGAWPIVIIFPLFALPVAFLLLIVLLVRGVARRNRLSSPGS